MDRLEVRVLRGSGAGAAEHVAPPTWQCQKFFHEACGSFARCPGCHQDAAPQAGGSPGGASVDTESDDDSGMGIDSEVPLYARGDAGWQLVTEGYLAHKKPCGRRQGPTPAAAPAWTPRVTKTRAWPSTARY